MTISIIFSGCSLAKNNDSEIIVNEPAAALETQTFKDEDESEYSLIMEILENAVPELEFYAKWISEKSSSAAYLALDPSPKAAFVEEIHGNAFRVSVYEQWEDHKVTWDWFLVDIDSSEVYWEDFILSEDVLTLDEWRNSSYYRTDVMLYETNDIESLKKAYAAFMININNEDSEFPVFGFYLLDMNFDRAPELAVLRHSGGSMGGYFTFYYFDGENVIPVLDNENNEVRCSNRAGLFVLENEELNRLFFYKELTSLMGNYEGNYGYIREVISDDLISVKNIIKVQQDPELPYEGVPNKNIQGETEILSDIELSHCVRAEEFKGNTWVAITSNEYVTIREKILPFEKNYKDLLETDCFVYLYETTGEIFLHYEDNLTYKKMTETQIDELFSLWNSNLQLR